MGTTIKTLALSQLTVGSHVQFHTDVYNAIRKATVAALHLDTIAPNYAQEIAVESTIIKRPGASIFTPEIRAADKLRDEYNALLFKVIDAYSYSPDPLQNEMALRLQNVTSAYAGMTRSGYNKQTAQITGLLVDLGTEEMQEAIEFFNLSSTLKSLREANNKFVDLIAKRDAETINKSPENDVNTREQRGIVDGLYRKITDVIAAYNIIEPSDINSNFIDTVNAIIDRYKRELARSSKYGEREIEPEVLEVKEIAEKSYEDVW